jgi:hypothetical protein
VTQEQAQDRLSKLRAIDPAVLLEVVRKDQNSSDFEITDWSVDRLNDQGFASGDMLFLFRGEGHDGGGSEPWSVVLKIVEAPPDEQEPTGMWYWKRELCFAQSDLPAVLAGPVLPPRFYGTVDAGTTGWIWMEHVAETAPPRWTLDEYRFAAHEIGRDNGGYLRGMPLPDFSWLTHERTPGFATSIRQASNLEDPEVVRALGEPLIRGANKLWEERERFFAALNALPQVFSHGDAQRRNLLIRHNKNRDELLAVDWAACGRQALGEEMWNLIVASTMLYEWEPEAITELEAAAYPAYLAGLADAGWSDNPDLPRLGFTAATAISLGCAMPFAIGFFGKDEMLEYDLRKYGCPPADLIAGWVALAEYALERADAARGIMERLGW